jgi:glycosyltransferase involved in cell wall biosynthesis
MGNASRKTLRACYFGTYRAEYPRNRLNIDRLRLSGVDVVECHATLWKSLEDRERVAGGGWLKPGFWLRTISAYLRLLWRYFHVGHYDVMVVGYPGQPDIPLARLLTWMRRKPLVYDVMMSIYLIAQERGLEQRSPISTSLIRKVERLACRTPDMLIVDTPEYAHWYRETYSIPTEKIRLLPLGADDRLFKPLECPEKDSAHFVCLYYGTFIRNHAPEVIVEAARLLSGDPSIRFEMIGRGPLREKSVALAKTYGLNNLIFSDWMDVEELVQRAACTDVLLGTFGITPQALMTMQHKIHEGLAMAKPIINGESPVMRSTLQHGETIYLCERQNPRALADAILALRDDPQLRSHLAQQGYKFYQENLTLQRTGVKLKEHLYEVAGYQKKA